VVRDLQGAAEEAISAALADGRFLPHSGLACHYGALAVLQLGDRLDGQVVSREVVEEVAVGLDTQLRQPADPSEAFPLSFGERPIEVRNGCPVRRGCLTMSVRAFSSPLLLDCR
jgi:hypothetical protein